MEKLTVCANKTFGSHIQSVEEQAFMTKLQLVFIAKPNFPNQL